MSYLLILADVKEREIIFCVGKIWIEWEREQQIYSMKMGRKKSQIKRQRKWWRKSNDKVESSGEIQKVKEREKGWRKCNCKVKN